MNILIQSIGFLAFIFIALSYWQKSKTELLIIQIFSHLLYAIHYHLLGGISGFAINLVGAFSLLIIYLVDKKHTKGIILLFEIIILYFIVWFYSYQNIFSIFPLIAGLLPITFLWQHKSLYIRMAGMIGTISWIVYAIYIGSYVSLYTNIIILISTCFAIYKLDIKENKKDNA